MRQSIELSRARLRQYTFSTMFEIMLVLGGGALAIAGFVRVLPTLLRIPGQIDFSAYYVAARVLNAHELLYIRDNMVAAATIGDTQIRFVGYIYPPLLATLLRPLAALPFDTARTIWFASNLLWLVIALVLLFRVSGWTWKSRLFPLVLLFVLTLPPVYDTLLLGQVNTLLLVLITGSLYLAAAVPSTRWKDIGAGVLLGIAAAIKLYPLVLGSVGSGTMPTDTTSRSVA